MPDDEPLSENEAHDLLTAARRLLGDRPGETVRAHTALTVARRVMTMLPLGLLYASEKGEDEIKGLSRKEVDE